MLGLDNMQIYNQIDYIKDIFNVKSLSLVSKCQTIHLNAGMKGSDILDTKITAEEIELCYEKVEGEKLKLQNYVPNSAK